MPEKLSAQAGIFFYWIWADLKLYFKYYLYCWIYQET